MLTTGAEATERLPLRRAEESHRTAGEEEEAHKHAVLVAEATDEHSGDGRVDDVGAEVGDLKTGGLELGDGEEGLEVPASKSGSARRNGDFLL